MTANASRISLLERDAVAPDTAALYDALLVQRGVVPNMFKVLAYAPGIAQGVAGFLRALLSDGALTGWYKELIAVRVSILLNSTYAITAHQSLRAKKRRHGRADCGRRKFRAGAIQRETEARFPSGGCTSPRPGRGGRLFVCGFESRVFRSGTGGIIPDRRGF